MAHRPIVKSSFNVRVTESWREGERMYMYCDDYRYDYLHIF